MSDKSYTWKIEGNKIEWCTDINAFHFLTSPAFTINGNEFKFYCDCSDTESTGVYGIQIRLFGNYSGSYTPIPVTVHAGFMSNKKFKFPPMTSDYYTAEQFIWFARKRDVLEGMESVGLYRDFFRFLFVFEVAPDPLPTTKKRKVSNEDEVSLPQFTMESMIQDFRELLRTSAHSDIRLKCKDGVLQAHKVVLAARSKVFAAMFRVDMKESRSSVVDMTDVNVAALKLFLEFVYTGKIENLPPEMVPTLYSLGDRYAVDSLRKMCAILMISDLSKENYILYLHLATSHSDEHLIKACISKNYLYSANHLDRSRVVDELKESYGIQK